MKTFYILIKCRSTKEALKNQSKTESERISHWENARTQNLNVMNMMMSTAYRVSADRRCFL